MKKCDVIIPVYNAPEYTKLCLYALIKNTNKETLNKIYIINDNSNELTENLLQNLKNKYGDLIELIKNDVNQGFIKNVNKGMQLSEAEYVLLLNTDCLIGKNTIERMINHCENDKKIGLICPLSNNSANLSIPMYPGFSYMMMDKLMNKKFNGICYDACTVVGNCLLITQKCIDKVGYFDEIYGMGYCDETDYQFQAMQKGFKAKVALDAYVYHKAEMSFSTTNESRNIRLERNRKIFFDRWEKKYNEEYEKYLKNDPIEYVNSHISAKDKIANFDFMFVCLANNPTSGGIRVIVDLVNYLNINGMNVGLFNLYPGDYNEIILFNIVHPCDLENIKCKTLISTIYASVFITNELAKKFKAKHLYFSQGYEFVFDNGVRYGEVEMSFKLPDYVMVVSNYLKDSYQKLFDIDSHLIVNGIDTDFACYNQKKSNNRIITMILRNEPRKADFMVLDIIKHLMIKTQDITINLIINNSDCILPVSSNDSVTFNKFYGPLTRGEIYKILRESDIFVDTSLNEGFGLMPLEAMANGCVPIISNSFGINDFANNNVDSFIINEVNDVNAFIDKIIELLDDDKKLNSMKVKAYNNSLKFDFDLVVENYLNYFNEILSGGVEPIIHEYTKEEVELLNNFLYTKREFEDLINSQLYVASSPVESIPVIKKQSRFYRFSRIFKEFIKANLYLFKCFIRTIFDKNYRI